MSLVPSHRWRYCALVALVSVLAGFMLTRPALPNFIESSGINIPTDDRLADYAYGVFWASILGLSILAWPVREGDRLMLLLAWVAKCAMALVLMLPYEAQYGGLDCWTYFQRAHMDISELMGLLSAGGANLVVAFGAIHLKIGPDSYHAMKMSFAMIGLIAIYCFYRSAELLLNRRSVWAFWVLVLYPTVLFWSSILGKDPLVFLGVALHVWGLVNVAVRRKYLSLFLALGGIGLASAVRIWMGPILLIPALVLLGLRIKRTSWRLTAVTVVLAALLSAVPATIKRLELAKAADFVEATQVFDRGWERANSSLKVDAELNSVWDILLFTPESIFIAYFRPLPGDVPHLFGLLAGCENAVLLAVSIWAVFRLRLQDLRNSVFLWAMALLLTWGLAYGLVAYKDLGTAVRFKLQIVPILLGAIGFALTSRAPVRTGASV